MKGQTLIEVLVALAIGTIIVTAVTVMVVSSLINSQSSRNQNIATRYAQEGMENIRSIRSNLASYTNVAYCLQEDGSLDEYDPLSCGETANGFRRRAQIVQNSCECGSNETTGKNIPKVSVVVEWADEKCTSSNNLLQQFAKMKYFNMRDPFHGISLPASFVKPVYASTQMYGIGSIRSGTVINIGTGTDVDSLWITRLLQNPDHTSEGAFHLCKGSDNTIISTYYGLSPVFNNLNQIGAQNYKLAYCAQGTPASIGQPCSTNISTCSFNVPTWMYYYFSKITYDSIPPTPTPTPLPCNPASSDISLSTVYCHRVKIDSCLYTND